MGICGYCSTIVLRQAVVFLFGWICKKERNAMPTPRKIQTLANLTEKMSRVQLAVVADYRGMTVAEMAELRQKMREAGAEVVIAKNTLVRMAARETGREAMEHLLVGPTAMTFAYDDPSKVANALRDYLKDKQKFSVRGGVLGTSLLEADALEQVAKMPSRQTLYAQILGNVQAPVSNLVGLVQAPMSDVVGCLNSAINNVVYVLQARIDQMQPDS
jgi:large subunit ribosomal protein L10